jgi:hypothetical protein
MGKYNMVRGCPYLALNYPILGCQAEWTNHWTPYWHLSNWNGRADDKFAFFRAFLHSILPSNLQFKNLISFKPFSHLNL